MHATLTWQPSSRKELDNARAEKMNNRLLLYSSAQINVHFSQPPAPNPPHHMDFGA